MIYLCTQGGLGNQLFQVAYALKLSKVHGQQIKLVNDHLNPRRGGDTRERVLEYLGFSFPKIDISLPKSKMVRSFYVKHWCSKLYYVDDDTPAPQIQGDYDLILDGFFQWPAEIEEVKNDVVKVLRAKLEALEIPQKSANHVAIHIRRGDYITDKAASESHGFLGLEYYLDAIKILRENIEQPTFDIYTDDSEWVRDNILPIVPVNIVSERIADANLEFLSMFSYKNFIIANSTFSWWAPWLNCFDEKPLVVCPKNWYGNGSFSMLNNEESWFCV